VHVVNFLYFYFSALKPSKLKDYASYENTVLVRLLARDDEHAFTELYNRYWQRLFAIAYNRLGNQQAAEDIVHDVFASLWKNRQRLGVVSLENYLATATKYLVFASIKKSIRERRFGKEAAMDPCGEPLPGESLHYRQVLELVEREVENLPEKCRLIFRCSRNEGLTVKEIAHRLTLSPKTVENQLGKALRRLKPFGRTFFLLLTVCCRILH